MESLKYQTVDRASMLKKLRQLGFKCETRDDEYVCYEKTIDFIVVSVQIWKDGLKRVSHFRHGRSHMTPTEFESVEEMVEAILKEVQRGILDKEEV